jgi:hypothetical protein
MLALPDLTHQNQIVKIGPIQTIIGFSLPGILLAPNKPWELSPDPAVAVTIGNPKPIYKGKSSPP